MTEKVMFKNNTISQQDIHIAFTSELKTRIGGLKQDLKAGVISKKGAMIKALSYTEFLNVLHRLSSKLYPAAPSQNEAFQTLLMENILPLAHRRNPQTIRTQLDNVLVRGVQNEFHDAILELYTFFASESQEEDRKSKGTSLKGLGFDELAAQTSRAKAATRGSIMFSVNSPEYGTTKSLTQQHWMKFAADFGLSSSMLLTQIEVSDIFLSSVIVQGKGGTPGRKMRFDQFWEAIVRCALLAWRNVVSASSENKIRALMVFMWKHFQEKVNEMNSSSRDLGQTDQAMHNRALVKASEKLMAKVVTMWSESGYKDFLAPLSVETGGGGEGSAVGALAKIVGGGGEDDLFAESRAGGGTPSSGDPAVVLVEDAEDLGDPRINIEHLRELLAKKPELGKFLKLQLDRAGIKGSSGGGGDGDEDEDDL
jgi:hypothetical protein